MSLVDVTKGTASGMLSDDSVVVYRLTPVLVGAEVVLEVRWTRKFRIEPVATDFLLDGFRFPSL